MAFQTPKSSVQRKNYAIRPKSIADTNIRPNFTPDLRLKYNTKTV